MLFIDTGAIIARYLTKDQHHQIAIKKWDEIKKNQEKCYTSNFILDETFTLLGRWAGHTFAAETAHLIYTSAAFTILRPEQHDEVSAIHLFTKYADQSISFTDCVSFVLMKKEKIKRVFSFDQHFNFAGFKLF